MMSYRYSGRSRARLDDCHPSLQVLFDEVIKHIDCIILVGHRGMVDQNNAYHGGLSQLKYPQSKHNSVPAMAVDVAPYPLDWKDTKGFYYFAGIVKGIASQLDINIRWGGDWDSDNDLNDQTFMDLIHFELK